MTTAQAQLESRESTVAMLQEELAATNREVMALTLELEQRVEDRTAQLSKANEELRREIAERMRAELEITKLNKTLAQRAELLETVNEELDAFSSSVSHDLRNPVARVLGFAELLREDAGPHLSEKNVKHLDRISEAGSQMAALIEDLLRLSRASHAELRWTNVDLNLLVDGAVAELDQEMRGRNILWKRPVLPVVRADAALMKQVMLNLISNALKYTRPRHVAEIGIDATDKLKDEWIVAVRDNGVGFDPANESKLFGAFQRLHTTQQFEGTGIGLANVRRIILRHGGRVWAQGVVDGGAAFYLSLPKKY